MLTLIAMALLSAQDPKQSLERTCFQTGQPYSDRINSRADVAIVYGIGPDMPGRVKTWRDRGYRIHLMTGVSWGEYQDYLYGRFDGINHEDEAQTESNGNRISHGGDVYYMSPGKRYGEFLCGGVQRALDAGVEAVHLEEPEFWVRGGYGQGFKNEWQAMYGEPWQDPDRSPDARWRASKLMYFLYRRALQQVFDYIQAYNARTGKHVRCYVPTHSLLNYAHWQIVSPESSLAKLKGCDGYIAQVWTGTARTPNVYQGQKRERTFETAFLEYGAMQNLVRATGRNVWYLADPVEDDPSHDWGDYRRNWESTLTASLLQPDVWQYEVMPWPERIFNGAYPSESDRTKRVPIPEEYATELQVVFNALKDMRQARISWDCGTRGIGVMVSDSLMFQRGPNGSDGDMSHVYGLAMPFLKRGMPVQPVQLENVTIPGYLKATKLLLMTYEGMKPLGPEVHAPVVDWVRAGGTLVFVDDDSDPFNGVREWWGKDELPRQHLFRALGLDANAEGVHRVGRGKVLWLKRRPTKIAFDPQGAQWLVQSVRAIMPKNTLLESGRLALRRGPYLVAAGLDETNSPSESLRGAYVDLFDPALRVQSHVTIQPGSRHFLVDLDRQKGELIAASGAVLDVRKTPNTWAATVEGIENTHGVMLIRAPRAPSSVTVGGSRADTRYDSQQGLLWIGFKNQARPQGIEIRY